MAFTYRREGQGRESEALAQRPEWCCGVPLEWKDIARSDGWKSSTAKCAVCGVVVRCNKELRQ